MDSLRRVAGAGVPRDFRSASWIGRAWNWHRPALSGIRTGRILCGQQWAPSLGARSGTAHHSGSWAETS